MVKLVISTSNFQSQVADLLPCNNCKKSRLTYGMIRAYDLLKSFDVVIENPVCRREDLMRFHSRNYIDTITDERLNCRLPFENDREARWKEVNEIAARWCETNGKESNNTFENWAQLYRYFKELEPIYETGDNQSVRKRTFDDTFSEDNEEIDDLKRFGLEGDCPVFSYLPMYIQVVTGATLSLVPFFKNIPDADYGGERVIAINWDGGRHHAARQNASGFCYVNDIVLLVQELRKYGFKRISYVDFDLHHGDGVENAFKYSNFIQTISIHLFETGFFPGTGGLNLRGGKQTANDKLINVPLSHGLDDNFLRRVVRELVLPLMRRHEPEVIIIQCGGDGLSGDKYAEWQLTVRGLTDIIVEVLEAFPKESFALLGGGGYNDVLMSRFFTHLTQRIVTRYGSKRGSRVKPGEDSNDDASNNSEEEEEDDDDDTDSLIPEHEYIEFYTNEHHKTWIYDQEGSSRCKHLINDNKPEFIEELKEYYKV